MLNANRAVSALLIIASGFGGYHYGIWTERQHAPAYQTAILSQSICTQRIDAALAATPRLVSDDPLLQGVIAVQSDRSKIPDDVLDFCAEIYPEDDDHDDHYFRR